MSILLRGFISGAGLLLIVITLRSIVRRDFSELQSLCWLLSGLVVMLVGIFPGISFFIARVFSVDYIPSIFFAIALVLALYGIFYCYKAIAGLQKRVQELAMQVSLLNQENRTLLQAAVTEAHTAKTDAKMP